MPDGLFPGGSHLNSKGKMKIKKINGSTSFLILLIFLLTTWVVGNVNAIKIKGSNPEFVAKEVIKAYGINLDEEETQVEIVEYSSAIPAGAVIKFRILENDIPKAEVTLQSFLGFGWQESVFQNLTI